MNTIDQTHRHAIDSTNKEFDVEIQREDAGAGAKRARHNSSLLDAHILKSGDDTENIPDSYVIFITENDVMKGNQPTYPVERYVTIRWCKINYIHTFVGNGLQERY